MGVAAQHELIRALAECFAGEATLPGVLARATRLLGEEPRWLGGLVRRYLARYGDSVRPRTIDVESWLWTDYRLRAALRRRRRNPLEVADWMRDPAVMLPAPKARAWNLPAIVTAGDLAEYFGITADELDWFANLHSLDSRKHYHQRLLPKASGAVRLIESPKPRLKAIQRRILQEILDPIPLHSAVNGFRKGRSVRNFVAGHIGQRVVVRMDLQDFFTTISRARVQAFFRTAGYPEPVADLLGGICTVSTPRKVLARPPYDLPHLPQGAPTSPALANLCAYRLDCRLAGLAIASDGFYTRYADDLAFSGNDRFARGAETFSIHVAAIAMEEGFSVHHRKTRIMRPGVRQYLTGVVVNEKLNVPRPDYDKLKAILTNCLRHGPASQNRDNHPDFGAHLDGRIQWLESLNPPRGEKLRALFSQIMWG